MTLGDARRHLQNCHTAFDGDASAVTAVPEIELRDSAA